VDICSGEYEDSYHGCPIEEEVSEVETAKRRAPRKMLAEAKVLKIEMLWEYKEVSKKSTRVQSMVKNRKLKKLLGGNNPKKLVSIVYDRCKKC